MNREQVKWGLDNPQVGQEVVLWNGSETGPRFYRLTTIKKITPTGQIRLAEGDTYNAKLTNDPEAIALCRQDQTKRAAERTEQDRLQAIREADPRWPVAGRLAWSLGQREWFHMLAALSPGELSQLDAILNKIQEAK